ncbi:uncharacterized protein LOC108673837 [Hyalella azteca]|uniref:Uncharacterized protein LOC108673837 n=1 Tax=Hyalella azteca TaxID=294128 RepID=A0A8B7NTW1_HYAAZ|nr:uncharacterized protein LOC108673837 [Hyalella azteca]
MASEDDFRYLTTYADLSSTGVSNQFTEYAPDLGEVLLLDNTIESVCATGFWTLYDAINYGANDTGDVCHFRAIKTCDDLSSSCRNVISSLRYSGSPYGINNDYYNLYEGINQRGMEFGGETDAPHLGDLDLEVSSLVVSGQSAWTFYTGQGYTGASVCVYTDTHLSSSGIHLDYIQINELTELSLPDNSIRSVKRGCLADRVVGAPPPWP